jgi:hypothetical protein
MSKDQIVTIRINMLAKLMSGKNFIQGEPCNTKEKVMKSKPPKASTSNLVVKTQGHMIADNASKKLLVIRTITIRSKDK